MQLNARRPGTAVVLVHPNFNSSRAMVLRSIVFEPKVTGRLLGYRRAVGRILKNSRFPVYVLHDESLKQRAREKIAAATKADVEFVKTPTLCPEPKKTWDEFCWKLADKGIHTIWLGGSAFYSGTQNSPKGCVAYTLQALRKRGFTVKLLSKTCIPSEGIERKN